MTFCEVSMAALLSLQPHHPCPGALMVPCNKAPLGWAGASCVDWGARGSVSSGRNHPRGGGCDSKPGRLHVSRGANWPMGPLG